MIQRTELWHVLTGAGKENDWWSLWTKHTPTPGKWPPGPPPSPSPRHAAGTVFAISANATRGKAFSSGTLKSYAIVYTAGMYPATDPDIANDPKWLKIARTTIANLPLVPYNGAQQIWNAAVRVGVSPEQLAMDYGRTPCHQYYLLQTCVIVAFCLGLSVITSMILCVCRFA